MYSIYRRPSRIQDYFFSSRIRVTSEFCVQSFIRACIIFAIHRRIIIGDKISGRHGNKGILARFASTSNMPYLPNGSPLDLVLNPLGIPSRINVGQIYEVLLGLSGIFKREKYFLPSFDECILIKFASSHIVFEKLREASNKTRQSWIFYPKCPRKVILFDRQTCKSVEQDGAVGESYILKLVHMVSEKVHVRNTGPYSLVTQQPVRGRTRNGGQRIGEMEVWALEGFGATYILQETLTVKSDDLTGRGNTLFEIILDDRSLNCELPDAFRVLSNDLKALCLEIILLSLS